MTPEKLAVPPAAAVRTTPLLRVMLPTKAEASAVLPPKVAVPLLPERTVTARPTVYGPPVSRAALALPLVSPNKTALVALPNAPALPEGALLPTTSVPPATVVDPVYV